MCTFYRGTIESILTSCITVWYGACNASCRKVTLMDSESSWEDHWWSLSPPSRTSTAPRLTRKALCIAVDPTHPTHSFFSLLPSGRRLRKSPGQDQQTEGQLHPSGCQEAELPPDLAPPPLSYPTHHWTLPPPPHTHTVTSTSHFVQHWTDLIQLPLLTVWNKVCSLSFLSL